MKFKFVVSSNYSTSFYLCLQFSFITLHVTLFALCSINNSTVYVLLRVYSPYTKLTLIVGGVVLSAYCISVLRYLYNIIYLQFVHPFLINIVLSIHHADALLLISRYLRYRYTVAVKHLYRLHILSYIICVNPSRVRTEFGRFKYFSPRYQLPSTRDQVTISDAHNMIYRGS